MSCGGLAGADLEALEHIEALPISEQFRLLRRHDNVVVNAELASLQVIGCSGNVAANLPIPTRRTLAVAMLAKIELAN